MARINPAAILPDKLVEKNTIERMEVGDFGWTVPWAMTSYGVNGCYLSGSYTWELVPLGTCKMRVTRTSKGFEVEVPAGYRYHHNYRDVPADDDVPVMRISVSSQVVY